MRKTNVFVCQQQRHFNQSVRPTLDVYGCQCKKKKRKILNENWLLMFSVQFCVLILAQRETISSFFE